MTIGLTFIIAAILLSSGNALNYSFAQTNTGGAGDNNSEEQNYQEFTECLEGEEGNRGYATEQQIRQCFMPIYTEGNNQDNGDDNGNNNNGNNNNGNNDNGNNNNNNGNNNGGNNNNNGGNNNNNGGNGGN